MTFCDAYSSLFPYLDLKDHLRLRAVSPEWKSLVELKIQDLARVYFSLIGTFTFEDIKTLGEESKLPLIVFNHAISKGEKTRGALPLNLNPKKGLLKGYAILDRPPGKLLIYIQDQDPFLATKSRALGPFIGSTNLHLDPGLVHLPKMKQIAACKRVSAVLLSKDHKAFIVYPLGQTNSVFQIFLEAGPIRQIAATESNVFALDQEGDLWGKGHFGVGKSRIMEAPVGEKIQQIAAMAKRVFFLTVEGRVHYFEINKMQAVQTLNFKTRIIQITATPYSAAALTCEGNVYIAGENKTFKKVKFGEAIFRIDQREMALGAQGVSGRVYRLVNEEITSFPKNLSKRSICKERIRKIKPSSEEPSRKPCKNSRQNRGTSSRKKDRD